MLKYGRTAVPGDAVRLRDNLATERAGRAIALSSRQQGPGLRLSCGVIMRCVQMLLLLFAGCFLFRTCSPLTSFPPSLPPTLACPRRRLPPACVLFLQTRRVLEYVTLANAFLLVVSLAWLHTRFVNPKGGQGSAVSCLPAALARAGVDPAQLHVLQVRCSKKYRDLLHAAVDVVVTFGCKSAIVVVWSVPLNLSGLFLVQENILSSKSSKVEGGNFVRSLIHCAVSLFSAV